MTVYNKLTKTIVNNLKPGDVARDDVIRGLMIRGREKSKSIHFNYRFKLTDERIIERSMKHPNWLAVLVVGHVGTTVPEVSVRISEYGCKMVQLYLFCVWVMFRGTNEVGSRKKHRSQVCRSQWHPLLRSAEVSRFKVPPH